MTLNTNLEEVLVLGNADPVVEEQVVAQLLIFKQHRLVAHLASKKVQRWTFDRSIFHETSYLVDVHKYAHDWLTTSLLSTSIMWLINFMTYLWKTSEMNSMSPKLVLYSSIDKKCLPWNIHNSFTKKKVFYIHIREKNLSFKKNRITSRVRHHLPIV